MSHCTSCCNRSIKTKLFVDFIPMFFLSFYIFFLTMDLLFMLPLLLLLWDVTPSLSLCLRVDHFHSQPTWTMNRKTIQVLDILHGLPEISSELAVSFVIFHRILPFPHCVFEPFQSAGRECKLISPIILHSPKKIARYAHYFSVFDPV